MPCATSCEKRKRSKQVYPKLLEDRVLVRKDESDKVTPGGIVLPDAATEKPQRGIVLGVGPGKPAGDDGSNIQMTVKAGDHVLYARYCGTDVELNGEEDLMICRESDILAVLPE